MRMTRTVARWWKVRVAPGRTSSLGLRMRRESRRRRPSEMSAWAAPGDDSDADGSYNDAEDLVDGVSIPKPFVFDVA